MEINAGSLWLAQYEVIHRNKLKSNDSESQNCSQTSLIIIFYVFCNHESDLLGKTKINLKGLYLVLINIALLFHFSFSS